MKLGGFETCPSHRVDPLRASLRLRAPPLPFGHFPRERGDRAGPTRAPLRSRP